MQPNINPAIGRKTWAIAEGYLPEWSTGPEPELKSHETVCILNAGSIKAEVKLTIYFANRDPLGPFSIEVPAQRTKHVRFDRLKDPGEVPRGTDFACLIESSVPVVVQHTRLDSRQSENALMSTIAFSQ